MGSNTFQVREEHRLILERLKSKCCSPTDEELIKTARSFFDLCMMEVRQGRRIASVNEATKECAFVEIQGFTDFVSHEISRQSGVELINVSLSFLEFSIDEVEKGRVIASVDGKDRTFRAMEVPVFSRPVIHPAGRA